MNDLIGDIAEASNLVASSCMCLQKSQEQVDDDMTQ
jgi:hypothetical protein